jgi:transposase
MGQYVGIDLHRRSTTMVRMAEDGEVLGTERFVSQPFELAQALAAAGPEPEVVLESTYGWYWAADVLQDLGAHVHLAHALGNNWGTRRVKNDVRDAQDLAAMLALGRLAEGWIAPPEVRELRELVRYRYSLIWHRTSAKAQIHGVMAKNGILPVGGELWGPTGQAQLDRLELPEAYSIRLDSLRNLLDVYERSIAELDAHIHAELKADPGYQAASWAGLTPKHRESDEVVHRGEITKQGSPLVRWAAIEAVGNYRAKGNEKLRADYRRIAEHAGKYKARVAVARKLLTLVFYALRDGEVRCLETAA